MNYKEFVTANYIPFPSGNIYDHAMIGILDEALEVMGATSEVNMLEELGDLSFYTQVIHPTSFDKLCHNGAWYDAPLLITVNNLASFYKKARLDSKVSLRSVELEGLTRHLFQHVLQIADEHGWDCWALLESNRAKLELRQSQGAYVKALDNRDRDAEYKLLESYAAR